MHILHNDDKTPTFVIAYRSCNSFKTSLQCTLNHYLMLSVSSERLLIRKLRYVFRGKEENDPFKKEFGSFLSEIDLTYTTKIFARLKITSAHHAKHIPQPKNTGSVIH